MDSIICKIKNRECLQRKCSALNTCCRIDIQETVELILPTIDAINALIESERRDIKKDMLSKSMFVLSLISPQTDLEEKILEHRYLFRL